MLASYRFYVNIENQSDC